MKKEKKKKGGRRKGGALRVRPASPKRAFGMGTAAKKGGTEGPAEGGNQSPTGDERRGKKEKGAGSLGLRGLGGKRKGGSPPQ